MSIAGFKQTEAVAAIEWAFSYPPSGTGLEQQYVMTQMDDENYDRAMVPLTSSVPSAGEMVVTFTTAEEGFALVEVGEYVYVKALANSVWEIRHDLGYSSVQVKCYDENDNEIYPTSISIITDDIVSATFETAITGHAVVKGIGRSTTLMSDLMARISYLKIGEGTTTTFDPVSNNDIETLSTGASATYPVTVREDDDYYYVECLIKTEADLTVKEIGIFDNLNNIAFYTKQSELFKPDNVYLYINYRVEKQMG
jgi:hypothetical protein